MRRTHVMILTGLALVGLVTSADAAKGGKGKPGGGDPPPSVEPEIALANGSDLATMAADGSGVTSVLSGASVKFFRPDWSPDGSSLVFSGKRKLKGRSYETGVYRIGAGGSGLQRLTPTADALETTDGAVWSPVAAPDGQWKILFVDIGVGGRPDVFAVNTDGSGRQNLTNSSDRDERHPTWSPDASEFAAVVTDDAAQRQDVLVFTLTSASGGIAIAAESNATNVSGCPLADTSSRTSMAFLEWAPVSDRIALYVAPVSGQPDVWVLDVATPGDTFNVTDSSDAFENAPTWSPDESEIAFWRQGAGIVRVALDGSSIQVLHSTGRAPRWR